ncbi:EF-hand domain-containing protein [Cinnamomum micranthum f. kanehirae]|uniref:EF-hand domain-containing protein n=1 Tax=Cinnamomum micranthum f. kanehirae TaxID=337451 RepID=A0A443PXR6_9MAGN|nr:EF-hand domain-containing protein [Cinnamomum micranthum f. kanehirae]
MMPGHDPVESFCNTFRDSILPLESGIRRAAKDLENAVENLEFLDRLNVFGPDGRNRVRMRKKQCQDAVSLDEKKIKCSSVKIPFKNVFLMFQSSGGNAREVEKLKEGTREMDSDASCSKCLQFAVTWSLLFNSFVQSFQSPIKTVRKCFQIQKQCGEEKGSVDLRSQSAAAQSPLKGFSSNQKKRESESEIAVSFQGKIAASKEGEVLSLDLFVGFVLDNFAQCIQKLDQSSRENTRKSCEQADPDLPSPSPSPLPSSSSDSQFDHLAMISDFLKGRKPDVNSLLTNMRFARVGGAPPIVGVASSDNEDGESPSSTDNREEQESSSAQKVASGLLNIPLSNVERLRSTLSTVSLTELIELVPHLGRPSKDHPDKKKLFSVQDFFRYTESEGRRFFDELDRDGDGQVTLEDLEVAMRKRKLPRKYARDFLRRTRRHLFSNSIGWKQFLSLMEQKEPTILRAYTTLCLSKSGTLQKSQILTSLKSAGLPANEDNAVAMMRFLNADTEGSISYGHFRNFMLLLPSERLEDDPRSIWFEAATVVAVAPPVVIPAGSVLKSALAGGLSCALSTSLMHPVDTMKTRVQASTLSFPELVSKLPQIGLKGLYRGSIPAILGQFSSHGLRTGIFEASKLLLINVAPTLPEIQVQSLASFCSTVLGTAARIPCEVLKQRLQAGIFDNVGDAIVGTLRQDGFKGFFRGTGATLCREVPFYVAGMCLYEEAKKAAQHLVRRDLEPWETIVVGALSGGVAAVATTPFDVMKTRMMTAPQGLPVSMSMVAFSILRQEGPLGLFKGAVPRFFWIAPLGAMNFAGYELARKAMDKSEHPTSDRLPQKV